MAKFTVYKDKAGEYRWQFTANNGKIVADSAEGYVQKADCLNGIRIVKTEAPNAPIEEHASASSSSYGRGW